MKIDRKINPAPFSRHLFRSAAEIGRVEADTLADLVIIDGDPLARMTDLVKVQGVMMNGRYRAIEALTGK